MSPERWAARFARKFWERVEKTDTCWLWLGSTQGGGYGQVWVRDTNRLVHRVAYELTVGPIPEGLTIDHLCRVKRCVRPDHLEPVTLAENIRREDASLTHCPQGHDYSIYAVRYGKRRGLHCRKCMNERSRSYWHTTRKFQGATR